MKPKKTADEIMSYMGPTSNINSLVHCATRLRFSLKDFNIPNTEKIKEIDGVLGVANASGQYQIIIGPQVADVYEEIINNYNLNSQDSSSSNAKDDTTKGTILEKKESKFSKILETIASLFAPAILALTGGGLIKALLSIFTVTKLLSQTSQTYQILNIIGDAPFYFLPFLLAYGTAKRFKGDIGLALTLSGVLLYPQLATMYKAGKNIVILGFVNLPQVTYSSSVLPIILIIIVMCYLEHWLRKISPQAISFFIVPVFTLLISAILGLAILGPIGNILGAWLSTAVNFMDRNVPWAVPFIIGAFMPYFVVVGAQYALMPVAIQSLAKNGIDRIIGPGGLASNLSQGGAALAVGVVNKDPKVKKLAFSTGITALCGITEPALYGVNLKYKYPLIAAMIGGGCGGLFLGITRAGRYAMGPSSILMLPAYIGGSSLNNFYCGCIGAVIAIVISFISGIILGKRQQRKELKNK